MYDVPAVPRTEPEYDNWAASIRVGAGPTVLLVTDPATGNDIMERLYETREAALAECRRRNEVEMADWRPGTRQPRVWFVLAAAETGR